MFKKKALNIVRIHSLNQSTSLALKYCTNWKKLKAKQISKVQTSYVHEPISVWLFKLNGEQGKTKDPPLI